MFQGSLGERTEGVGESNMTNALPHGTAAPSNFYARHFFQ
ncbi:protein of unknown function [Xenorhabdus poinarii G6]|uniref:Uncharacterized protein n=1 Tax=Xenorhabdus poinarii G6 TaxID=1354304 RepID=A0A068R3P2_9GAMM|nr:protein of unknown function [Xenorhabdus poinarii G6]